MLEKLYLCREEELNRHYGLLPPGLKLFIGKRELVEKLIEIRNNTSSIQSFRKRFFGWFNMFKIIKYLNFIHKDYFEKLPVVTSASELLIGREIPCDMKEPLELLLHYRKMERGS
jgi:hypothetical protein